MKHLKHYQTPEVLREVAFEPGASLLDASVVDKASVTSMGQKVEDYNFSPDNTEGFNHTWGD
ncbi:MAG: hypothetical protein J5702_03925 [Bacteroidales bacterium]|nr:hypothetical protein [Bacteroidales bacterium]